MSLYAVSDGITMRIKMGSGEFNYSENRNLDYKFSKQKLYGITQGEDTFVRVESSFLFESLSSDVDNVYEVLKDRNCTGVTLILKDECRGDAIEFPDFKFEKFNPMVLGSSISFSGICKTYNKIKDHQFYEKYMLTDLRFFI